MLLLKIFFGVTRFGKIACLGWIFPGIFRGKKYLCFLYSQLWDWGSGCVVWSSPVPDRSVQWPRSSLECSQMTVKLTLATALLGSLFYIKTSSITIKKMTRESGLAAEKGFVKPKQKALSWTAEILCLLQQQVTLVPPCLFGFSFQWPFI